MVIWTDGACAHQAFSSYRRAGIGAFWGDGHPGNIALPLEGPNQTNSKAELTAVLRAAQVDLRPIEIRSDSQYVVSRFSHIEQITAEWGGSNLDLWLALAAVVAETPGRILVTKVKGHASWGDVELGVVNFLDKRGNAQADALARDGAERPRGTWEGLCKFRAEHGKQTKNRNKKKKTQGCGKALSANLQWLPTASERAGRVTNTQLPDAL